MQAEWRSVSMECGEQCVIMDGIAMMPEFCADNWDFLDQVLICTVLCKAEVVMHWTKDNVYTCITLPGKLMNV